MILHANPLSQGLIFDLDGTLIDSLELNWRAMDDALQRQGIVIPREEFVAMTGRALEEIADILVAKYKPDADASAIVARKREVANSHISDVQEITAVANVVRENYGVLPMAVGTGSDAFRAKAMLKSVGLLDFFDVIVSADDVVNHKPAPDTFLRCAELMGLQPSVCEVFEDGDTGLRAARTAGMLATDVRPFI